MQRIEVVTKRKALTELSLSAIRCNVNVKYFQTWQFEILREIFLLLASLYVLLEEFNMLFLFLEHSIDDVPNAEHADYFSFRYYRQVTNMPVNK